MTRTVNRALATRLRRAHQVAPLEAPGPAPARPQRRVLLVVLALLTVYVVWGSTFLAISVAIQTIPPFTMMAIRFAIAGGLLFAWAVRRGDRTGDRVTLRQWRHAILTGGLLLVGGTGLVSVAQTRIASGTAALLCATVPLWMALLSRGVFGERLSRRAWLGLLVGFVGVAALVDPRGGGHLGAMLLVLFASGAWAAGSLRSRVADAPTRPLVAAAMEMLGAALVFAVISIATGEAARVDWAAVGPDALGALAYLVTAGSLLAFTAYSWLLRNASTTLVGTYAYVNPVVAVLLGWSFAGELVTGRTVVAGAVILGSVVLLITGRPGEPVPAQATSGGDVFAGEPRWHRARKRLGGLPSAARLYRRPGVEGPRPARRDQDHAW